MGARSTPIRSKPIKKKSNFTCTLEHDQPPSDQKIRSKPIKKKSNFTCTLEHDQPPSDQKNQKKIKIEKPQKLNFIKFKDHTPVEMRGRRLYLNPRKDLTINPKKSKKNQ